MTDLVARHWTSDLRHGTIPTMSPIYHTIAGPARHEIPKIKGSRFIADIAPARSATEAEAVVSRIRGEFPDAHHHCWAWRMGRDGGDFRYSDDGEPSGTAGRPIFQHLEGAGVTYAVIVVTRYFGGTKLGAGGLVRAYGGAAAAVLAAAEIQEVIVTRRVTVRHGYDDVPALKAFVVASGIEPSKSEYEESVCVTFDVPEDEVAGFVRELTDRTAGRAKIEVAKPR